MNTIINKIDYISKTKNRTKKIIHAKNKRQINSNLPCKFGHFRKKLNFWAPKKPLLNGRSAQTRYVIWHLMPIIFLPHCTSFISRWSLLSSQGVEGGVCISLVGKQPSYLSPEARMSPSSVKSLTPRQNPTAAILTVINFIITVIKLCVLLRSGDQYL